MTMESLGAAGVPGGGGAIRVQDQGPAQPVDHDLVVVRAQEQALADAGRAAVGLVLHVVYLAGRGGLAAAARPAAAAGAGGDGVADAGPGVPAEADRGPRA